MAASTLTVNKATDNSVHCVAHNASHCFQSWCYDIWLWHDLHFVCHTNLQPCWTTTYQLSLELVRAVPSWIPGAVLHTGEFGLRDAVIGLSQALTDGGGAGLDESANKILKK